jgi:hypothetical protein
MGRTIRAHHQAQEGEAGSQGRRLYWASRLYEGNPLNMPPPVHARTRYLCPTIMTMYSFPADAYKG